MESSSFGCIVPLCPVENPTHFRQIKELSDLVFPIKYPDSWLKDILSPKFQKTVCFGIFEDNILISMVIARIMAPPNTDLSIPDIFNFCKNHKVCYVVMLGTRKNYRRRKAATRLLDKLKDETTQIHCDVILLHSIAYQNYKFYENYGFEAKEFLENYYFINNQNYDGQLWMLPLTTSKITSDIDDTQTEINSSSENSDNFSIFKAFSCCLELLFANTFSILKRLLFQIRAILQKC